MLGTMRETKDKGVWFGCFLFLFLLKIENGDKDVFDWIFVFIFSEDIFPNESETENNKI